MLTRSTLTLAIIGTLLLPPRVFADPIVVTSGTVAARTWDEMGAHFLAPIELGVLTTHSGLANLFYPPGASAPLRNRIQLSDVDLVGAFNGRGSIDFDFRTGQVVQLPAAVPPDTIGNPFYATYTPRFTFTGRVLGYDAAGQVAFDQAFTGVGESRFLFHGVIPPSADREGFFLTDTIFNFQTPGPVPEPATILMMAAGMGLFAGKRRIAGRSRR
jgi:hypothetical protein